ncbi:MAG: Ribonuclease P protein component 2 [Candidatus Woesearchaeota archaeon]|nr:Ribonuclease P protein component 2 [Candidatus Woesearchaeota archaeon]
MKPILPSLRQKKRFLVFEIISNKKIKSFELVKKTIKKQVLQTWGEIGSAKAGLLFIKFDYSKQRGIIKIGHKSVDQIKTCLSLIKRAGRQKVIFKTVGVSGILNKAKVKYLR